MNNNKGIFKVDSFIINEKDNSGLVGYKFYAKYQGINSSYLNQEELKQLIEFLQKQVV